MILKIFFENKIYYIYKTCRIFYKYISLCVRYIIKTICLDHKLDLNFSRLQLISFTGTINISRMYIWDVIPAL